MKTTSEPTTAAKAELSCRVMKSVLVLFQREYGRTKMLETSKKAAFPYDINHLEDENRWMSFEEGQRLLDGFAEASGDPLFFQKAGHLTISKEALGLMHSVLKAFGNPRMLYQKVVDLSSIYNRVGEFTVEALEPNRMVLVYK